MVSTTFLYTGFTVLGINTVRAFLLARTEASTASASADAPSYIDALETSIANKLVIGDETVKTHLSSIYRKLGVNDRTGAVATALREGIYQ